MIPIWLKSFDGLDIHGEPVVLLDIQEKFAMADFLKILFSHPIQLDRQYKVILINMFLLEVWRELMRKKTSVIKRNFETSSPIYPSFAPELNLYCKICTIGRFKIFRKKQG